MADLELAPTKEFRVFKYPLQVIGGPQELALPFDAAVLKLGVQYDVPCIWAQADVDASLQQKRVFQFVGTGHVVPEHSFYVDTILLNRENLVLHLYEVRVHHEEESRCEL